MTSSLKFGPSGDEMMRPFTEEDAVRLLQKKITGLIVARDSVVPEHSFYQSVLHIWTPTVAIAKTLTRALAEGKVDFQGLEVVGSLDIWISVCSDPSLYSNKSSASSMLKTPHSLPGPLARHTRGGAGKRGDKGVVTDSPDNMTVLELLKVASLGAILECTVTGTGKAAIDARRQASQVSPPFRETQELIATGTV
jgi:hypothetical protein